MILAVIGATSANAGRIASLASSRGIHVVIGSTSRRPDWVIVATAAQRRDALALSRVPAFRVIELPEAGRDGALDARVISTGLARMVELGPHRRVVSPLGIALVRRLMPRIMAALELALGDDAPDMTLALRLKAEKAAQKAAEKAAKSRERSPKTDTPEEARRRAERKAQRKAARRVESSLVGDPARLRRTQ